MTFPLVDRLRLLREGLGLAPLTKPPIRLQRAVGYCTNDRCSEYAKGIFIMNPSCGWRCCQCHLDGHLEGEHGAVTKAAGSVYREVQVEWHFDVLEMRYRAVSIVRDESLETGSAYLLRCPMISASMEKRAMAVAVTTLATLNQRGAPEDGGVPRSSEIVLALDAPKPIFERSLAMAAHEWELLRGLR